MDGIKKLVIIPAWNEEASLPATLKALNTFSSSFDVLVVNDGSVDSTLEIVKNSNVRFLSIPINIGVGAAMRAGFKYARDNNYARAIQFDADLQHPTESIPALFEALENSNIVIGSRFQHPNRYSMSRLRRLGSIFLGLAVKARTGLKLTDVTSGFRAMDRSAIELFAEKYPSLYLADTVESLIIGFDNGLKIVEIPTNMNPRLAGKPSHNPLKSFLHLWRVFLVIISTFQIRRKMNEF